jgi:hypothetical protein
MPMQWNLNAYIASLRRREAAFLQRAPGTLQAVGQEGLRQTREGTPVDEGDAQASWRLEQRGRFAVAIRSEGIPYINILEFGGYPTARFRTGKEYPPGPRTQAAPAGEPLTRNNVSRQAPHGMLRLALLRIRRLLTERLLQDMQVTWRL